MADSDKLIDVFFFLSFFLFLFCLFVCLFLCLPAFFPSLYLSSPFSLSILPILLCISFVPAFSLLSPCMFPFCFISICSSFIHCFPSLSWLLSGRREGCTTCSKGPQTRDAAVSWHRAVTIQLPRSSFASPFKMYLNTCAHWVLLSWWLRGVFLKVSDWTFSSISVGVRSELLVQFPSTVQDTQQTADYTFHYTNIHWAWRWTGTEPKQYTSSSVSVT